MTTRYETLVRIVDHSFDPPRCLFGTREDVLTGYAVDSLKSIGLAKANWYMRGDLPPRYPMPATCAFHMSPYLQDHWELHGLIDHT